MISNQSNTENSDENMVKIPKRAASKSITLRATKKVQDDKTDSNVPNKLSKNVTKKPIHISDVQQDQNVKCNVLMRHYNEDENNKMDRFIYCDNCKKKYEDGCPTCGFIHIADVNVQIGVPNRAILTTPKMLMVTESKINGYGVVAKVTIDKDVRMGPYEGRFTDIENNTGYSWKLKNGKVVDASDVKMSNWMRYVNCARHSNEQNLVAFQYRGNIFYRTSRKIHPEEELLVYYGDEFANMLGINTEEYFKTTEECSIDNQKQRNGHVVESKTKNTKTGPDQLKYACIHCEKIVFSTEKFLIHLKECKYNVLMAQAQEASNENNRVSEEQIQTNTVRQSTSKSKPSHENLHVDIQTKENRSKSTVSEEAFSSSCKLTTHAEKPYTCKICGRPFSQQAHLKMHLRVHAGDKPYKCGTCDQSFTQIGYLKLHNRLHTGEKPFKCAHCQKTFSVAYRLETHLRVHTGEKSFTCDICYKGFTQLGHLKEHILRIHTEEKPYKCSVCEKVYTSKLTTHICVHTGENICRICKRGFTQKIDLRKHMLVHTDQLPYTCKVCKKAFALKDELITHICRHTGESTRNICYICDQTFKNVSTLKTHTRVHTGENPFKCEICQKAFAQQCALKEHIRLHTEKPCKCTVCEKAFTTAFKLILHSRIHTGENPYKCNICDKAFVQAPHLKRHIRLHTGSM